MKRFLVMLMVALFSTVLIAPEADAKRLGGGRSVGKQSDLMKRDAARPPAQQAAPASGAAAGGAAAAGGRSWMGPLAGIAAGLGLAALASYLGFGEELATFMLMALLAVAVLVAVRMFMARRNAAAGGNRPAFAGAGAGQVFRQGGANGAARSGMPWSAPGGSAAGGTSVGAGSRAPGGSAVPGVVMLQPAVNPDIPTGFDTERFLHNAKVYFVRLQAASDRKQLDDLREFTSPEMFAELKMEIMQRGDAEQTTDVVQLDARLLGVEVEGGLELASVRFDGLVRETTDGAPESLQEVWNFTRPADHSAGWVLGGIQQVA